MGSWYLVEFLGQLGGCTGGKYVQTNAVRRSRQRMLFMVIIHVLDLLWAFIIINSVFFLILSWRAALSCLWQNALCFCIHCLVYCVCSLFSPRQICIYRARFESQVKLEDSHRFSLWLNFYEAPQNTKGNAGHCFSVRGYQVILLLQPLLCVVCFSSALNNIITGLELQPCYWLWGCTWTVQGCFLS